jgi:hypothetical protein
MPSALQRTLASPGAERLWAFVRCHQQLFAVATEVVERLVLPAAVRLLVPDEAPTEVRSASLDPREPAVVAVDQQLYAAWDLGQLLQLPPLADAWILMRVPHDEGHIPVALRIGTCLSVGRLTAATPLPAGVFRARQAAFSDVFTVDPNRASGAEALFGVCLDPLRLWTTAELESARAALSGRGATP